MRVLSYVVDGYYHAGIQDPQGDEVFAAGVVARAAGIPVTPSLSVLDILSGGAVLWRRLEEALHERRTDLLPEALSLETLTLGPPVPQPQKIICLGLNYPTHVEEVGRARPDHPMFFAKFANSLIGSGAPIVPPRATQKVDYEGEIAIVIGRRTRYVAASQALASIAGVTAFNDVTARDLASSDQLWTRGKAIDTFAPCGPALVLMDEIEDLSRLGVRTRVNGELRQQATAADMVFSIPDVIASLSQTMTLEPGDIIATGTPSGVGARLEPPRFLEAGDEVEVEVDHVGILRNRVATPEGIG